MSARFQGGRRSSGRARSTNNDVHQVGYGKPPQAHQFKPGRSGNPRGRPRGVRNETTILHDLLNRKIEVREGGRARKIIVLEAILLRFTEDALRGNTKTAAFLFNRYAGTDTGDPQSNDLSKTDREVLDDFIQRFKSRLGEKS